MTALDQQWTDLYASGRVRWMVGMSYSGGDRVVSADDDHVLWTQGDELPQWEPAGADIIPDWSDPATIGCLLHQAREAWGDAGLTVHRERMKVKGARSFRWKVRNTANDRSVKGCSLFDGADAGGGWVEPYTTEPAAILAAIAAAPPRSKP